MRTHEIVQEYREGFTLSIVCRCGWKEKTWYFNHAMLRGTLFDRHASNNYNRGN